VSAKILVVEDEPAIADAVGYALAEAGYDVDTAGDGDDAIAKARDTSYDLMILDLLLPGTQGMEVCRTLRSESDLPIVMLTAREAEADRVGGLEVGADDYVTKPFSIAELVSRVRALLRRRELEQPKPGSAAGRWAARGRDATLGDDRRQAAGAHPFRVPPRDIARVRARSRLHA